MVVGYRVVQVQSAAGVIRWLTETGVRRIVAGVIRWLAETGVRRVVAQAGVI